MGVAIASIFALWLFRKVIRKYWIGFTGLVIVVVLVLVGLNHFSNNRIFSRLKVFNLKEQIEITKSNANDEKNLNLKTLY